MPQRGGQPGYRATLRAIQPALLPLAGLPSRGAPLPVCWPTERRFIPSFFCAQPSRRCRCRSRRGRHPAAQPQLQDEGRHGAGRPCRSRTRAAPDQPRQQRARHEVHAAARAPQHRPRAAPPNPLTADHLPRQTRPAADTRRRPHLLSMPTVACPLACHQVIGQSPLACGDRRAADGMAKPREGCHEPGNEPRSLGRER